jgi:hypothetical protein
MEELQTKTLQVSVSGKTMSCQIQEKDYGDLIVFDVLSEGNYLFTLTQQGDVLFNEAEMTQQKTIMDPRQLNELIDMIKEKIGTDQD